MVVAQAGARRRLPWREHPRRPRATRLGAGCAPQVRSAHRCMRAATDDDSLPLLRNAGSVSIIRC
jgi:hypothetical protein